MLKQVIAVAIAGLLSTGSLALAQTSSTTQTGTNSANSTPATEGTVNSNALGGGAVSSDSAKNPAGNGSNESTDNSMGAGGAGAGSGAANTNNPTPSGAANSAP